MAVPEWVHRAATALTDHLERGRPLQRVGGKRDDREMAGERGTAVGIRGGKGCLDVYDRDVTV